MTSATVLVVEDEVIVAADITSTLSHLGYRVVATAAEGTRAVELALEKRPDLVLMDIHLQGPIDGIEAATRIREQLQAAVVSLTAHSDPDTLERAQIAEPFGYVLKPFDERALLTQMEIALCRFRIERQVRESERRYRELADAMPQFVFRR